MSEVLDDPKAQAEREKRRAALSSVVAAVFLTGLKLGVGLATNSLGVLSEAAHSALDLAAAALTFYAVRLSGLPPDERHPYGHGKVENLSALAETLLLAATCVWIVREGVERLLHPEPVQAGVWGIAVMAVSVAVDYSRSRMLLRMARKHNSQALEADALHFSTDIWSSAVVIAGLAAMALSEGLAPDSALRPVLARADALAALAVSVIVAVVCWRMGASAVQALLDGGDGDQTRRIREKVAALPGVIEVRRVRARSGGPESFVDMELVLKPEATFEEAHHLAALAEEAAREVIPGADVVAHFEPGDREEAGLAGQVRLLASGLGLGAHAVRVLRVGRGLRVELHVEAPEGLTLAQGHAAAHDLEGVIRERLGADEVVTHLEPTRAGSAVCRAYGVDDPSLHQAVLESAARVPGVRDVHQVAILRDSQGVNVSFHCRMAGGASLEAAHEAAERLEAALRERCPGLARVLVHLEPE
jgi:cation diffusion facilitator family transporter